MNHNQRNTQRRPAFTLIELLLALGLSVTLLVLVALAIQLCLDRIESGREGVERARLAAGIFELMSADMRSVRTYDPQDTSAATAVAEEVAEFDVDSLDSLSGGSSSSDSSSTTETADQVSSLIEQRRPLGVYGSLTELQIDLLRVPPDWQGMALLADPLADQAALPEPPTASITTVTYGLLMNSNTSGGLARSETNRDVLSYGEIVGGIQQVDPMVVAPEVTGIEFRYFNGTQLVEMWDMEQSEGALPQAIQVVVWLAMENGQADVANGGVTTTPTTPQATLKYSITVPLRGLENAVNDEQEADDEAAEPATASTSTTPS